MAQDGTGGNSGVPAPAETASSRPSLPPEAQRDIRTARNLTLLALPFVVLLFNDIMLVIFGVTGSFPSSGSGLFFAAAFGGLYVVLIYALVYRRLTPAELSGALGATLVLGLLTLFQGLIPFGWGLGVRVDGLSFGGEALAQFLLLLGIVPGILLLLAYQRGARAERRLREAVSTHRA